MKWRSKETLEAYEHYFDAARHAETLDVLHARMYQELERFTSQPQTQSVSRKRKGQKLAEQPVETVSADEPDLDFLYQLGGSLS